MARIPPPAAPPPDPAHSPRSVHQVMVSSTFTDLKEHRAALVAAIQKLQLHPCVMEYNDGPLDGDVVDSSFQMVRDSAAYILIISLKYGQVPECPKRNPKLLSLTELEFNEAQRLKRPIRVFIMSEDHDVKKAHIESDPEKEKKLNAFRERAKKASKGSKVNRVYAEFNSLKDFKDKISAPLSQIVEHLRTPDTKPIPSETATDPKSPRNPIPAPPAWYADRDYIGRNVFIGRQAQLQELSNWAKPKDPSSVLLFKAIGGNGKSMLTWHWAKDEEGKHARAARKWAGRFWYSFYEKGAVMADFCRRALAYMTGQPFASFEKRATADMQRELMAELHAKPWLLVLDGLERVLVHYHRIDASTEDDDEANRPTDKILNRDPCDAIRPEDNDLLRALASAAPSKILVSSRLVPRVLLSPAGIPLPGVRPLELPGLDDADAEALLRSCGVNGKSEDIQYYLKTYCANHPLVIGVLAGLVNSPGKHRGDFDGWAADPDHGAKLNLAGLGLIQQRNDILDAALSALEPASRQLLSTLALLSDAVDYDTLAAFNPHMPQEPEEVPEPTPPEESWRWRRMSEEEKDEARSGYQTALVKRGEYEKAREAWRNSAAHHDAPAKLGQTIKDLEDRGLLQYDSRSKRYDMHPVVRGVAAGAMNDEEKNVHGQRVVDHFNSRPHSPYEKAKTMEDVENGLHVVRTLLKLGRFEEAADAYRDDLADALFFNLEAHFETLAILRPFFPDGWGELPSTVPSNEATRFANSAANALDCCGEHERALEAYVAGLRADLKAGSWHGAWIALSNTQSCLSDQRLLAKNLQVSVLVLNLAALLEGKETLFSARLGLFEAQVQLGQWEDAEGNWALLDPMGRAWSRNVYRQGDAEYYFALCQFRQSKLGEEHLAAAEALAAKDNNRGTLRDLHRLRGAWRLEQGAWDAAAASFSEAVRMAHERKLFDEKSETGLALAKFHLGQLTADAARVEAERLAQQRKPANWYLALLWQAIGERNQAARYALEAYKWAWADGEPYVDRYELTKATELLRQLNVPIPVLPPYDPAKDEPFPWEAEVRAAIEKLRAKKEAKAERAVKAKAEAEAEAEKKTRRNKPED